MPLTFTSDKATSCRPPSGSQAHALDSSCGTNMSRPSQPACAGLELARAFSSGRAGPVIGHLLLALLGLAAGVIALVWPSPTALVLTLVVGVWAVMGGLLGIFAGF